MEPGCPLLGHPNGNHLGRWGKGLLVRGECLPGDLFERESESISAGYGKRQPVVGDAVQLFRECAHLALLDDLDQASVAQDIHVVSYLAVAHSEKV